MLELPYIVLIAGAVLVGLWISNIVYDLSVPNYISRKVGHFGGGLGYLIGAYVFDSGWYAFLLSAGFVILLWGARVTSPNTFRGVGGSGRPMSLAEVWFPLVALPVIGLGWIWLDRPMETVACLLFMAWGDGVTGLVRSQVYHKAVKGFWGSAAMLIACIIIAWAFIIPFWPVGVIGAVVATGVEWLCGDVGKLKWADDNWAIPVTSFIAIFGLLAGIGAI